MNSLSIMAKLGSDTHSKLAILLQQNHLLSSDKIPKSGAIIDATISYCIELAYNALMERVGTDGMPNCILPPETKKAERLYAIYQRARTLKDGGMKLTGVAACMTQERYPTADDLYASSAIKHMKVTRWTANDVKYVLNTDELNSLMRVLNGRRQRKPSRKCESTTS
ncbi:hypothetical protein C0557_20615 [Kosakonia sp. MUSA4]|nr:hypothetical protein C0557_20615 [Kosakonia sp. MUSA4]